MNYPAHFGKYLLLEKIGTGGMAELFLAKQTGLSGFEKIVAIKRILPHLTENGEFVSMFINEAKLAALLTHQNIVQIYDLGSADGCHYIAMEYILGKDLRTVIQQGKARSRPLSVGDALLITSKICAALDYAHRKRDLQGNELRLVHRDISPQNILLSYEGEVKLVDFGIAKAAMGGEETKTGVLKGKLAYMSPEQAWGKPVDGRTDLFALGIVLYEAVTGTRLFSGNDEISILEKVRKGEIPSPTQFNPAIPPELETVLQKALAKEPEDRYQSASEMEMALEGLITEKGYAFSSLSLSTYMQALLADEIAEDTQRFQRITHQPPSIAASIPAEDRSTTARPLSPRLPDPQAAVRKSISQSKIIIPPSRGRRFSRWVAAMLFLISCAVFSLLLFLSDIGFVVELRSKFPALEESKVRTAAYLEDKGLLTYLDGFKNGIFRLVETGDPAPPPSTASAPDEGSVAVTLARPELGGPASLSPPPTTAATETPVPIQDIPTLYKEAKESYEAGRIEEVEQKLRQIIETDPKEVQAYHLLSTVYQEKKEPDTALRILTDAAPLFPEEAILHYDLGFLYFNKGIDSLAIQELKLGVKLAPRAPEAGRAREILQKLGQRPRPAAAFQKRRDEPPLPNRSPQKVEPLLGTGPSLPNGVLETANLPPNSASSTPSSAPNSANDSTNDSEKIRSLLAGQKKALESKDLGRALQAHLQPPPILRQRLEQWFHRFDRVSANYEIYDMKIEGNEAFLSLLQTIVLQPDGNGALQVEKALVYWKLAKIENEWKISTMKVVEKY
ncbi:MAG: protein kinase [Candidatus Manganitrophaceae bacterium]